MDHHSMRTTFVIRRCSGWSEKAQHLKPRAIVTGFGRWNARVAPGSRGDARKIPFRARQRAWDMDHSGWQQGGVVQRSRWQRALGKRSEEHTSELQSLRHL